MTRPSRYDITRAIVLSVNWFLLVVNGVSYLRDRSLGNSIAVILPAIVVFGFEVTHRILKRNEASAAARDSLNDKMANGITENMAQLQRAMSTQLGASVEIEVDDTRKH